jgi:hypothetical protein
MMTALRTGLVLLVLGSTLGAGACKRETPKQRVPYVVASASAGEQLDGMQLSAARRVTMETARTALQHRDLPRLKQLSVWVRHRAQVVLFEPDDLAALDLAIQCLEQSAPPTEQLASLDRLSGTLRGPARDVCQGYARK